MKTISAENLHFSTLNEEVRQAKESDIIITGCQGHRYIAAGLAGKNITIEGTPGNALGAYLDGSTITVNGSAQDATGDTMNAGKLLIKGNCGDAAGYGMRGGSIFIRGDVGYRAGIHMKAYKDAQPVIVVGGKAGSFLGEYQAGGTIVVLGLEEDDRPIVGEFCATGMHGGKIVLRTSKVPEDLPAQVNCHPATKEDMEQISGYLDQFCQDFSLDRNKVEEGSFIVITPNTKNPYRQLYTHQ